MFADTAQRLVDQLISSQRQSILRNSSFSNTERLVKDCSAQHWNSSPSGYSDRVSKKCSVTPCAISIRVLWPSPIDVRQWLRSCLPFGTQVFILPVFTSFPVRELPAIGLLPQVGATFPPYLQLLLYVVQNGDPATTA